MKQFKRFSLAIFVLAFIASCEDGGSILSTNTSADPSAADPSYCDSVNKGNNKFQQFLCIGSEVVRVNDTKADGQKWENWCPQDSVNGQKSKKYGHYYVLVDSTEGYEEEQYALLINQMLSKENTDLIGPYDKISVMNIAGQDEQATELKPIFSDCKPRSGEAGTIYPLNEWLDPNKTKADMEKTNNAFREKIDGVGSQFANLGSTTGQFSQIMEQLKEISRNPQLDFGDDYAYRKIIIFSDLMQHSKQLSLISKCRDKKKCDTYEKVKGGMVDIMWEKNLPTFGDPDKNPEVFVYYLQCRHDQKLDIGLIEIWESYFEELGINMSYDIETSCEDIYKDSSATT